MASISTRTGDGGTTSLYRGGRVAKTDPRIEALGDLDELSALLGCAAARGSDESLHADIAALQEFLVSTMAEVATAEEGGSAPTRARVTPDHLAALDRRVAELETTGIAFKDWNGVRLGDAAATLDLARTVCRRAERRVWAVGEAFAAARPLVPQALNRLSDLLWLLARSGI